MNAIVRMSKFALGDITESEFYAQESIDEQQF